MSVALKPFHAGGWNPHRSGLANFWAFSSLTGKPIAYATGVAYGFGLQGWQLTITLELILVALCVLGTVLFLRERRRLRVRSA